MRTERSTRLVFLLSVLSGVTALQGASAQETVPAAPAEPSVADLIERIRAKEKATTAVSVKMRTRSALPDGAQFETSGTLRVLGATHFHVASKMRMGEGMEGEHEVVHTPEGTWMRDLDPIQGEVFTVMTPELIASVEAAAKVLGDDAIPGAIPGQNEGPLGSALLVSLDRRFALRVDKKVVKDGIDHWVLRGEVRPGQTAEAEGLPDPDSVEVVVSERPLSVVRMAQFDTGKEILVIEIDDVQIDPPFAPASFKLDSRGKRFVDAMDYPPMAAQITAMLDKAKAVQAEGDKPPATDRGK